jgi:hypothetical protein
MLSKKLLGIVLVVSLAAAAAAQADEHHSQPVQYVPHHSWFWFLIRDHDDKDGKNHVKAPEIDPATAFSGFTLLAGGLAVIRGRRFKK